MKTHHTWTWATCLTLTVYVALTVSATGFGCWCCISAGHAEALNSTHHGDESPWGVTPNTSCRHGVGTLQVSLHAHVCSCCDLAAGTANYTHAVTGQPLVEKRGQLPATLSLELVLPQISRTSSLLPVSLVSDIDLVRLRSVILII